MNHKNKEKLKTINFCWWNHKWFVFSNFSLILLIQLIINGNKDYPADREVLSTRVKEEAWETDKFGHFLLSVESIIPDFPFSAPPIKAGHRDFYTISHSKAWGFYCVPSFTHMEKLPLITCKNRSYFVNPPSLWLKGLLTEKRNETQKSLSKFMQLKF